MTYIIIPSNIKPHHISDYKALYQLEKSGKKYKLTEYARTQSNLSYPVCFNIRRQVRIALGLFG